LNPLTDSSLLENLMPLAQGGEAPELNSLEAIFGNPVLPIVVTFFLYYFIVLAPERKKKREVTQMKSSLKKNDRIITIGGIHGTVVNAPTEGNVLTIRIDEAGTTKIKINRSAVGSVIRDKSSTDGGASDIADLK
jgi:preprotein translocase subunit YajC